MSPWYSQPSANVGEVFASQAGECWFPTRNGGLSPERSLLVGRLEGWKCARLHLDSPAEVVDVVDIATAEAVGNLGSMFQVQPYFLICPRVGGTALRDAMMSRL